MADKDDIIREDDGPEDKGGQQKQTEGQQQSPAQVLRPIDDVPLIRRSNGREQEKPEFEIIEVDSNNEPIDGLAADRGGNRDADEGNLSEEQAGERSLLDQRREEAHGSGRRESPRDRRERRKVARERERTETAELRLQVGRLADELSQFKSGAEKRLNAADSGRAQADLARIERDIAQRDDARRAAETKQREALSANDPDAFMAAQNARDEAVISKVRLENQHEALKARLESGRGARDDAGDDRTERREADVRTQKPQQPPPLVGQAKRYAEDFMRKFDWYDPQSRDPDIRRDSMRIRFLDAEVYAEGYNPQSNDYWDELESRMRDVIPHAFDDDDEDRDSPQRSNGKQRQNGRTQNVNGSGNGNGRATNGQQTQQRRNGPPVADVGGRGGGRKIQVRISPDRKRAMIEAGSLNADGSIANQTKFDRTVREYAAFDTREGVSR